MPAIVPPGSCTVDEFRASAAEWTARAGAAVAAPARRPDFPEFAALFELLDAYEDEAAAVGAIRGLDEFSDTSLDVNRRDLLVVRENS